MSRALQSPVAHLRRVSAAHTSLNSNLAAVWSVQWIVCQEEKGQTRRHVRAGGASSRSRASKAAAASLAFWPPSQAYGRSAGVKWSPARISWASSLQQQLQHRMISQRQHRMTAKGRV